MMRQSLSFGIVFNFVRERIKPFLIENTKIIARFIFTLLFIAIGIWFLKHEHAELSEVKKALISARWAWVLLGILITILYILLQGQMYVYSFASVKKRVSLFDSTILFIKRNLISIFLPAGGISSLAFFTGPIEKKGIKTSQIHFASSIYGFIGIVSVIIVAIPAFIFAFLKGTIGSGEWYALGSLILLSAGLYLIYRSIMTKGWSFRLLVKIMPALEVLINDMQNRKLDNVKLLLTIITSVLIEFTGIAHLYISMLALGFHPSLSAAVTGYIISVIFLIISPFLRGFGAIEVSMAFVLVRFGFTDVEAIAITFLYRFFEFWLPLLIGVFAFLSKINKLLMRILPAVLLMGLGIVNVVSVLTPAISERLVRLKSVLPVEIIKDSNYLVMFAGLFLLVTAAFMLKGLRSAWWFALILSVLSFIGHITKAIDFEEALIALMVIVVLIATRKEYYVKTNPKMRIIGIQTSLLFTLAVMVYGIIGFYLLDEKHFNIDFDIFQSIRFTLQNYFLIGSEDLVPHDLFANHFLLSINISGFVSISFLIYTFVRSYKNTHNISDEDLILAKQLMVKYGRSPLDFFKTYSDKMVFFSKSNEAFISYRVSGNFAVVLENPVAGNDEEMKNCIREFDRYCYESGMKSIYYRVPETSLPVYRELRKKELLLGQEGVVELSTFSIEDSDKKSLRKAVKKLIDRGYKLNVHNPPIKDGILQKIKSVSDEWLTSTGRHEIIFSQGMFCWEELKQQTILTVENEEEKIITFLNIIPDYTKYEATYDLLRKTTDAPNGAMDFVLVEFFNYLKSIGIKYVNLGFAPMSGLNDPQNFPERSMKFAYEKIRSFSQYKGMRDYKEKFRPVWRNQYLIYQHDYDLLQIPAVLSNVIKPSKS